MKAQAGTSQARSTSPIFKGAKAFPSFSTKDLKKAKEFYGQTLGLKVSESAEGLELQLADGLHVFIYPKPNHTPASFTVLNFKVDDIDETLDELKSQGITPEKYNQPDLKTDAKGIMSGDGMRVAWFKDPSGNILSVIEEG